jgi:hypothetical protein
MVTTRRRKYKFCSFWESKSGHPVPRVGTKLTELQRQIEHGTGYSKKKMQFHFFCYLRNLEIRGIIKYLKRENPQGNIKNVKECIRRILACEGKNMER